MSFKGHYPEWHTVLLLAFHWPECSQIGNVFFEGVHCCSTYNWDSVSERKMRGNIGKLPGASATWRLSHSNLTWT